jgi:hypothetical protein
MKAREVSRPVWGGFIATVVGMTVVGSLPLQAAGPDRSDPPPLAAPAWDCAWRKRYVEESSLGGSHTKNDASAVGWRWFCPRTTGHRVR